MPDVRLLAGYFGSADPYATNDFETMEVDVDTGTIASIYGEFSNGGVTLGPGYFGP
jgi:hypothetical protein